MVLLEAKSPRSQQRAGGPRFLLSAGRRGDGAARLTKRSSPDDGSSFGGRRRGPGGGGAAAAHEFVNDISLAVLDPLLADKRIRDLDGAI